MCTLGCISKSLATISGQTDRSKRSADDDDATPPDRIPGSNFTCTPAADWTGVAGIDEWCSSNCPHGNDEIKCLTTYCDCKQEEGRYITLFSY